MRQLGRQVLHAPFRPVGKGVASWRRSRHDSSRLPLELVTTVVVVIVAATSGCLTESGNPQPPNNSTNGVQPPRLISEEIIQPGDGFEELLANFTFDGSFVLSATFDATSEVLYAFYSDDTIRAWSFRNRTALNDFTWILPGAPCPKPGIQSKFVVTVPMGPIVASCGRMTYSFNSTGTVQASVEFGDELMGFDVASNADRIVGALGRDAESRVEVRQASTGTLISSFPVGNGQNATRTVRVSMSSDGQFVGLAYSADQLYLYRATGELLRTFGGAFGAIDFAENASDMWVTTFPGGEHGNGTLRRYELPTDGTPILNMSILNSPWDDASGVVSVYVAPGGRQAAYISLLEASQHYSDGNTTFDGDEASVIYVVGGTETDVRGFGVPNRNATSSNVGVVSVTLMDDGSAYAVSVVRTVLSGSAMWLTFARPDSSPPTLVRVMHPL